MDYQNRHPVIVQTIDEVVSNIKEGDIVAIGGFWLSRIPVALVNALVQKGVKNLTVVTQLSGLALDQLIAANLVKKVIFTFASLDIFGLPPFFRKAIENKQIDWEEWTALRMVQALEAGRQNLPSLMVQPPIGTDLIPNTDFKLINCPFTDRTMGILPALQPDVSLIHAQRADERGNIQFQGALGVDRLLIGASKQTFISVEEIVPVGQFVPDPRGYLVPHFLINRICHVPGGAYPSSCLPYYITDYWQLSEALPEAKQTVGYENIQKPSSEKLDDRLQKLNRFVQVNVREFESALIKEHVHHADVEEYSIDELMAVLLAKQVENNTVSTVGSNTPLAMVAYLLAKKTHAPNAVIIPFTGLNDVSVFPVTLSLAEVFAFKESTSHWANEDLWQWIYQSSLTSIEFGSTAQIDKFGRINNSIIGSSDRIKVRLPGQGGLADVLNLHQHFITYITRQDKKRMVENVDYISGQRYYLTPEERAKAGLPNGVSKVITNLGIFELDITKRSLVMTHIHPNITLSEVANNTGFELDISDKLQTTDKPTKEQLHLIRHVLDPFGFRKLEFLPADERTNLIRNMLENEQRILFGKQLIF